MSFEEVSCFIKYDAFTDLPTPYWGHETNVEVECRNGSIEFRKYPTGILLYREECAHCRHVHCTVCFLRR